MNLHARVATVAAVHLLARRPLGWLKELELDTPTEVWCETNGPGDDLRLVLVSGSVVEAQAKKGLSRGEDLWTALTALAHGIHQKTIGYGVLVVDADASSTIRSVLARGVVRLGEGRTDSLDNITSEFKRRLEDVGLPAQPICAKLRIVLMHCADHDDASEKAARSELARLCATERDAIAAWQALQLAAHGLIERRGRWTGEALSGVLRTAAVELSATPGNLPLALISGWVWEHLDETSPCRGFIESFRQHYLVSERMAPQPFGGRDAEFDRFDSWLYDADAPSRMLISAPTARGKSALLVNWIERLGSDATWAIVFVPISLRFNTDRPAVFYALLARQLARVLQRNLVPPVVDVEAHYQGIAADLFDQVAKQGQHVLIVVDGLDEAQSAGFNPTIFPPALPPNVKVLVSAREQVGDCGPEGWLRRLDWQRGGQAISRSLPVLDRLAVAQILESVGLAKETMSDALVDRLTTLSAGEPLLLALYAEDLRALARSRASVGVEALEGLSPGISAYFSRAFGAQNSALAPGEQDAIDSTLTVLAMALGPLEGGHLTDLVCKLCGTSRPAASDRFVRPLKRFIAGDGSIDHGYVLNHPKLGEYLREERFDSTTRQFVEQAYLEWGRGVAKALDEDPGAPAPTYVLRYHVNHMSRSASTSLDDIDLLLCDGWRQAWHRLDKDFVGYADSLLAASAAMQACVAYGNAANRALRLKVKMALSIGSVKSQGANVPSELLTIALQEQLIALRQGLNIAELQVPENQPDYFLALAPRLPAADLERVLAIVRQTANADNRIHRLARVAAYLRAPLQGEVVGTVLSWLRDSRGALARIVCIATLTPALDNEQLEAVLTEAMSSTLTTQEAPSAVMALTPAIANLRQRQMDELAEHVIHWCLRLIDAAADPLLAVEALGTLAPQVSWNSLEAHLGRLVPLVKAAQVHHATLNNAAGDVESRVHRERLTTASVTLDILATHRLPSDAYRTNLLAALAPLLVPDLRMVDSLARVAPLIRADLQQEIVALGHQLALKLPTANNRTHALVALARIALPPLRQLIIGQALMDARRIEDDYSRCLALVSLSATVPEAEREQDIVALLAEIQKVDYLLHIGELLLRLSTHAPAAAGLADSGLHAIQRVVQHNGFGVNIVLREIERFPQHKREAVFRQCWKWILSQTHKRHRYELFMAAKHAAEYWTATELDIVRGELSRMSPDQCVYELVNLLPVVIRLGANDLIDEAVNQISKQENPNDRLSHAIEAIKFLPTSDLRDLLRRSWLLALKSDAPRISSLIDGFELLNAEDQVNVWPKLTACAKAFPQAGLSLARLSLLAKSSLERTELLEAALSACANEKADHRIPAAAQIVLACKEPAEKLRAFDLLTSHPAVPRPTVLAAVERAAPGFAEIGGATLTRALMDDIRQSARWWP